MPRRPSLPCISREQVGSLLPGPRPAAAAAAAAAVVIVVGRPQVGPLTIHGDPECTCAGKRLIMHHQNTGIGWGG